MPNLKTKCNRAGPSPAPPRRDGATLPSPLRGRLKPVGMGQASHPPRPHPSSIPSPRQWHQPRRGCGFIDSMTLRPARRTETGLSPALGLLLLAVLWAVSSLSSDLLPHSTGEMPGPMQRQAALFSVFAVLAAFIALARRLHFPRGRRALACAGTGLGLFVVPSILVFFAHGAISALDRVAVFSLTPVFAVVLEPYFEESPAGRGKAALAGAMSAVAGVLLVLPLDIPGSYRAAAALCALVAAAIAIAAANCFAVRLAHTLADGSILPMAALASAAGAVCFVVAGMVAPHAGWRWSGLPLQLLPTFLLDLPALFLLFWLMRRLAASRMTARFLLAPLFTILLGLALVPALPPPRAWLGMALLAGGAGWLLLAPPEQTEGVNWIR